MKKQPTFPSISTDQRDELTRLKFIDRNLLNVAAEDLFQDFLCSLLDDFGGSISLREVISECSFELDLSPETIKRYILKHTARRGRFTLLDGLITCKKHNHLSVEKT